MISINISEEVNTIDDLPDMLRHIADQIESGGTLRSYYPDWNIKGEEEPEDEEGFEDDED
jgi:hypothetical protein